MAITVSALLDLPHLALGLWAGGRALDRAITWAHVCELTDPTPWYEGGELVMTTGMAIPTPPRRQAEYIARLAGHGLAALAISDDLHAPHLSEEMRAAAERHDFPVLTVPLEVPFIAVSRVVAAAAQNSLRRRLLGQVRVLDTMRLATRDRLELPDLLHRLEGTLGHRLYLLGSDGNRLLPTLEQPPAELVERLWPRSGPLPARVPGGYLVTVPISARSAAYLLAIEAPDPPEHADLSAIHHAATLAALGLERIYREREVRRREGAETLSELLSGTLTGDSARRRLELEGFDISDRFLLLAADGDHLADGSELNARLCEEALAHLLLVQRHVLALVPASTAVEKLVRERLLDPAAPGEPPSESRTRGSIGASAPFGLGERIANAKREALWSLRQAQAAGEPFAAFTPDAEGTLLLPNDPVLLRELVGRVLGPVMAYDHDRGTELLRSVRMWLEHDRQIASAASELHVHQHTLRYRLGRVEKITGRKLSRSRDIVEVWLAIQALELEA